MKTVRTITLLASMCFLSLILPSQLFGQDKGFLTVKVYESHDKAYHKIIVTGDGKKLDEIDLLPFSYKDLESNQITINRVLDKYSNSGYHLKASTAIASGVLLITTYVFGRE